MKKFFKRLASFGVAVVMFFATIPTYAYTCEHTDCTEVLIETSYGYSNFEHLKSDMYEAICNDCGEKNILIMATAELHTFNANGNCICGYTQIKECSHYNREKYYTGKKTYISHNDTEHYVSYAYDCVCMDCGKSLYETFSHKWETHTLNSEGKCECGYEKIKQCSHSSIRDEYKGEISYISHNNEEHYKEYSYNRICNDCGEILFEGLQHVWGSHTFNSFGQCDCGYVQEIECRHMNVKNEYNGKTMYLDYNDAEHYIEYHYDQICKDCNEKIDETVFCTWTEHLLYSNGSCECGYVQIPECPHDNIGTVYTSDKIYDDYDDEEHCIKRYFEYVCEDCDKTIDEDISYKWVEHDFNRYGECECGYEEPECSHRDTEKSFYKNPKCFPSGELKHGIKYYYQITCEDCGEIIDKTIEFEYYPHRYDAYGKCQCGHTNSYIDVSSPVCYHTNFKDYYAGNSDPITYNDSEHYMKHHMNRTCEDCGQIIDTVYEYVWKAHKLDANGKCESNCGYPEEIPCSHTNIDENYYRKTVGYVSYTASQHRAKQLCDVVCLDCGEILGDNYTYEYGSHKYDANGKCVCGYAKKTTTTTTTTPTKTETSTQTKSSVEIVNYSIELDNSQDYVTIKAEGNANTKSITICIFDENGNSDSLFEQKQSAEARFKIPYSDDPANYEVIILASGEDKTQFSRADGSFTATNPKGLFDWTVETAKRTGATLYGYTTGFINSAVIDPSLFILDLANEHIVNIFDEDIAESNDKALATLEKNIDEFLETRVSDENADCYYIGKFSGETTELAVGLVCAVGAVKGIVKNVVTHSGGIKTATIVLENGDEALAIMSKNSDDVVMITSQMDEVGQVVINNYDEIVNFKTKELLDKHYLKHRSEFGNITKEDYLKKANDLINSSGSSILTKFRTNGDKIFYNSATNEFAVLTSKNILRTYFKPAEGIEYFYKQ